MSLTNLRRFGIHELVGHGKEPSPSCGVFRRWGGCLGGEGAERHDVVDVYNHNFHGKVALQRILMRCYSARCPTCFKSGWAKREADRCEARLLEASKRFGLVEHGTISVPVWDSDRLLKMGVADFKVYWRKMEAVLVSLGVVGGVTMFHPTRYSPSRGLYWSPHWHFDGFVVPSYGGCRRCSVKKCMGKNREYERCDGFESKVRRENARSGLIIKVFGRRRKEWIEYVLDGERVRVFSDRDNVRGTLSYELGHAGLIVGSKRANVVHWFGVCAPRRLKVTVESRKQLCPICGWEFVHIRCLSSDAPKPMGLGVHIVDLYGADGEPYYIEAFASSKR
jgi:hypothetical protein